MPNTLPEGITPQPYLDLPRPEPQRASSSFLMVLSILLGVIIGVGTVVGVLGKAFFVDRAEYVQQNLRRAEERVEVSEALKRIDAVLGRQEAALNKLSGAVEEIRTISSRRGGR